MPKRTSPSIAGMLALCATLMPIAASAWDSVVSEPLASMPADFKPQFATQPDASGFWAFGGSWVETSFQAAAVRYDNLGKPQFARYPQEAGLAVSAPVPMPDGGVAVEFITSDPYQYMVSYCYAVRFDAQGNYRWRVRTGTVVGFNVACEGELRPDGVGGLWLWAESDEEEGDGGIARLDDDGAATFFPYGDLPRPDPDGSDVYVLTPDATGVEGRAVDGTLRWKWAPAGAGGAIRKLLVGRDGNLYGFGIASGLHQGYAVSLTRNGDLRWEKPFSDSPLDAIESAAVDTTGASYVVTTFNDYLDGNGIAIQLLKLNVDGTPGWPAPFVPAPPCNALANSGSVAVAPNGDVLFLHAPSYYCNQTSALYRLRNDSAAAVYRREVPANPYDAKTMQVAALADGSTLLTLPDETFRRIDPHGGMLPPPQTSGLLGGQASMLLRDLGSTTAVSGNVRFDVSTLPDGIGVVTAMSQANGLTLWQTQLPFANRYLPNTAVHAKLLFAAGGSDIIVIVPYATKIRIAILDAASGFIRSDRFEPCLVESYCAPTGATLDSDGILRVTAQVSDVQAGLQRRVYTLDDPLAALNTIPLDQPGIAGAWYPEYAGGQGFTIDWIAGARTIFMPFFTFAARPWYDVYAPNAPAALSWYGLQGTVAPGAHSADLAIAVTEPGAFAAGVVAARVVGTAHLTMSDCAHATLSYQFDAGTNEGIGGLLSLTRLTPSTSPCVLADGSTTPAQDADPPSRGFDARQSGSWYAPATGGQGLELTIVPPGSTSQGLVFAAWFTFDPAGADDDANHQHWFTLQGDLSAAANGAVALPIYRILGGSFDGVATQNSAQVGSATLTMLGCDSARLDYAFDASAVAHAFAAVSGSLPLAKIGGCSAQ